MGMGSTFRRIGVVLEMIKFQHSVFALPFALAAMLVAAGGLPAAWTAAWIVLACVFARSAAMAFNRWTDVEFDRENPRTRARALVTGALSRRFALAFTVGAVAGFVFSAAMLNRLCLGLSPVAVAVILGYSYVKRFSELTHLVLGLALGIAPVGAWLAVRGSFDEVWIPLALSTAVVLWTAGFDIIYACQDYEHDQQTGLHSIPKRWGMRRALWISAAAHAAAMVGFLAFWGLAHLGWATLAAMLGTAVLLSVEHALVKPSDLARVNTAFFTINGLVSFAVLAGVAVDVLVLRR